MIMSKENVKKFYELLDESEELRKELQKRDKEYAEAQGMPAEDASDEVIAEARRAAAKEIVLPLAKEQGLEFSIDEMIEYENEELDDDELALAAGGTERFNTGCMACLLLGVGAGRAGYDGIDDNQRGMCFMIGLGLAFHGWW
jgi:aspartate/methionine/tyrosine aminotransferase